MKKILFISFLFIFGFIVFAQTSQAAFLDIDRDGNFVWQVLSEKTEANRNKDSKDESTKVELRTSEQEKSRETKKEIKIKTEDGRVKLQVGTKSGETEMDVTELEGDIVSFKERKGGQEIKIRVKAGRIEIKQKAVGALTHFPVSVNPETNELTITTPSGTKVVAVLPAVAVQNILASNIMDRILSAKVSPSPAATTEPREATEEGEIQEVAQEIELVEEQGVPAYKIQGIKTVRFLNLVTMDTSAQVLVSAQTGKTLSVSRPWFLNFFGFLFTQ